MTKRNYSRLRNGVYSAVSAAVALGVVGCELFRGSGDERIEKVVPEPTQPGLLCRPWTHSKTNLLVNTLFEGYKPSPIHDGTWIRKEDYTGEGPAVVCDDGRSSSNYVIAVQEPLGCFSQPKDSSGSGSGKDDGDKDKDKDKDMGWGSGSGPKGN